MLTCKQASYLASKKLDKKLTLAEQMNFLFHTAMCRMCRLYARDMKVLHQMMLEAGRKGQALLPENSILSQQARDRIKQALDKALHLQD